MRRHYSLLVAAAMMAVGLRIAHAGTISTVAGPGNWPMDGVAATSSGLYGPCGSTFDSAGNLYIADTDNCLIRRVDAVTGIITTVAGTGTEGYNGDGILATNAQLDEPYAVDFDASGNLYIADSDNNRIRKVDATTGIISTVAGVGVDDYNGDGILATNAQLCYPCGIAFDASGNLYIADTWNHRIRKVDAITGLINTVAGTGTGGYNSDGVLSTSANLYAPTEVAFDHSGNLYIADAGNHRIRKVDAVTGLIGTLAGTGTTEYNGDEITATSANISWPNGIFLDASINIYIADLGNNRIRKVDSITGLISTVAGNGVRGYNGDGILATNAQLDWPTGVILDGAGNMHIADYGNDLVRKVDAVTKIITTEAGTTWEDYSEEGISAILAYIAPVNAALDGVGNLYIAEGHSIRKIDLVTGLINRVAGTGYAGYNGDDIYATVAQLSSPKSVAFDGTGNLYISDSYNHRIRKIDAITGIISTVAGTGTMGYNGDGIAATAADLDTPQGLAIDDLGNLFIAEYSSHRIRKVDAVTGLISTVAGSGEWGFYNGDGIPAIDAILHHPVGIALDARGNLYIADSFNLRIRKVDVVTGLISTVAGTGIYGYYADGIAAVNAYLYEPKDIDFDGAGNLYIADTGHNRIRKVDAITGLISTVAGTGHGGYNGDGIEATEADIYQPTGIALDRYGNLYIADSRNYRIRRVVPSRSPSLKGPIAGRLAKGAILAAPNVLRPSIGRNLVIHMKGDANVNVEVEIYDEVGGFIATLEAVLDGEGYGQAIIQGGRVDGKLLAPGAYWALVKGGGVNDKKRFMVGR